MTFSRHAFFLASLAALAGCGAQTKLSGSAASAARSNQPSAEPSAVARYTGLAAPESVFYDADRDRYLVSNVNGGPTAKDNNGFISELSPDGRIVNLKFIEGGKNGAQLDAPKGLTISGGLLFVTDVSAVRTFDAKTGAPKGEIEVPGSTFLNGITASPDGKVYVTDSGPPTGRFDAVGTEAVYVIEHGRARALARGNLGRPTGVLWTERGLVVVPFGANEIYRLDAKGKKRDVTKTPAGGLAGIVQRGDWLLVTSFEASSIFRGKLGQPFQVALADQESPADIGYDTKRSRLLVPHFDEGTVSAFELR
jgi:sugar lactone lactonase YvrE